MNTLTDLGGLRSFARRVRNRWRSAATVLLYHRVTTLDGDPQLLSVTQRHFDEQMAVLRRIATPISLREMHEAMENDSLPRRTVAVTFDDGYADNFTQAAPILRRHAIPATCFVAGGAVDAVHEFYWDELQAIFLEPGALPEKLKLMLGGVCFEQALGEFTVYTQADAERHRAWSLEHADATPRHQAYRLLCDMMRSVSLPMRDTLMRDIRVWAGRPVMVRSTHRTLSADELRDYGRDPLIEIGAHTASHAMLSTLSDTDQFREIQAGRERIEGILGRGVSTFSYPYGSRRAYDSNTVRIVRETGFRCACSNFPGRVDSRTDAFQIPRVLVRDWDGNRFEAQLREWFDE